MQLLPAVADEIATLWALLDGVWWFSFCRLLILLPFVSLEHCHTDTRDART